MKEGKRDGGEGGSGFVGSKAGAFKGPCGKREHISFNEISPWHSLSFSLSLIPSNEPSGKEMGIEHGEEALCAVIRKVIGSMRFLRAHSTLKKIKNENLS